MNVLRISSWCTLTALVALGATIGMNQHSSAQQASAADQEGVEVLTRGPVHEAFTETISFDPQQGIVAPKTPPSPIDELTPPQRPEGNNLAWIPGYWAWDDERNDYLWLSGIWRALPPGRQWVPGYWGQSEQGYQWTSGYWADAAATEVDYLPEPPATVEAGPNSAAPTADDIWLPGSWIWQQDRYAWRAGYWTRGNQEWDWIPDHYVWTPSGYVFVDGYYDHSVSRRGVVFAPVYFNAGRRAQRGYSYTPSTVIDPGVFLIHLFLRPSYGHYYFGDYYGSNYADAGFSPWISFHSSRRGYDPIYANRRWRHRQDRNWEQRSESEFRNFRDNEDSRPPRTVAAQMALEANGGESDVNRAPVVTSLDELAGRKGRGQRFQPVNDEEQQRFRSYGREYRKSLEQRQQLEANTASVSAGDPDISARPARRKLARSPYVATPTNQVDVNIAPPVRHEVLSPEVQVEAQPTARGGKSGARRARRQEAVDQPQQQDLPNQLNFDSQDQPRVPGAKRHKPRGASNDGAPDWSGHHGEKQGASNGQLQDPGANRDRAQRASKDKPQDAPQAQPQPDRNSKKRDKD